MDKIDRKMLQLLQQRIKLSGQIGRMKRRHGAVIYVPDRERDLVARLVRQSKGKPSPKALAALYREIMSDSRAAQGQTPIGLLQSSASTVLPVAHISFGACDKFSPRKTWAEIAKELKTGALSLALLTGDDLATVLKTDRWRKEFFLGLTVAGDFASPFEAKASLGQRIFIVTPQPSTQGNAIATQVRQALILIECNSTANAIKSLLRSMPPFSIQAEHLAVRSAGSKTSALVRLTLARAVDGVQVTSRVVEAAKTVGLSISILGIYPGTEDYGG